MFNKSTIMQNAHAAAKACMDSPFYKGRTYAQIFAGQLRRIWASEKVKVAQASRSNAQRIQDQIVKLENKDFLGWKGLQKLDALRVELQEAA